MVEKANAMVPGHAHVARSKIAVVPVGGLIRAPKGTVVRQLTIKKWSAVIEKLYEEKSTGGIAMGTNT